MNNPSLHNEKELLLKIAEGDEKAFNIIYEHYWQKVYAYMESIVKDPQACEEMVADIFLKLWQWKEGLAQVQNIGGFLRVSSRNKALDFIRMTARKKELASAYRAEIIMQKFTTAEDRIVNAEMLKIWQQALSQLSPQRQRIFLMHREEGLSYHQIAERLNISPRTVKKTMSQALESLREFLQQHYKDCLGAFLLLTLL